MNGSTPSLPSERRPVSELLALLLALFNLLLFAYRLYHWDAYYPIALQVLLPVGCALAVLLLAKDRLWRQLDVLFLLGFGAWQVAVLAIHGVWLTSDFHYELYALLFLLALHYPLGQALARSGRLGVLRGALYVPCLLLTAVGAWAVWAAIAQAPFTSPRSGEILGLLRNFDNRLSLFSHPNIGACYAMMCLLLNIYLGLSARHWLGKVYNALAVLVLWIMLPLTDARTSMIAVAMGVGLLIFLWLRQKLLTQKPFFSWTVGIVCAGVSMLLCYLSFSGVVWGVGQVTRAVHAQPTTKTAIATAAPAAAAVATRPATLPEPAPDTAPNVTPRPTNTPAVEIPEQRSLLHNITAFSGRTMVWKAAAWGLMKNPEVLWIGTTPDGVMPFVWRYVDIDFDYWNVHNAFLQVLVGVGLPGLLLLAAFLVLLCRYSLRLFFDTSADTTLAERFLPVLLLCCMLISMLDPLFFNATYPSDSLFFLAAGYIAALAKGLPKRARRGEAPPAPKG